MVHYHRDIHIECYAGYRGEEEPRRFMWRSRTLDVVEILDRWLDPNHRYFKVLAGDGGTYMLRHDADSGMWELGEMHPPPSISEEPFSS
jgi:hypothetical protein